MHLFLIIITIKIIIIIICEQYLLPQVQKVHQYQCTQLRRYTDISVHSSEGTQITADKRTLTTNNHRRDHITKILSYKLSSHG